jgi:hypothetical protein
MRRQPALTDSAPLVGAAGRGRGAARRAAAAWRVSSKSCTWYCTANCFPRFVMQPSADAWRFRQASGANDGRSGCYTFALIAAHIQRRYLRDMSLSPKRPLPLTDNRPGFRLVVKARTSGRKDYVWEIVREDDHPQPLIDRSSSSYRSMEEAFTHGSVALALVRSDGAPESPD